MRLLYLGLPLGAVWLARAGFRPVVACLGHPDAPGARRVRRRLGAAGTLVLGRPSLDDPTVRETLALARPDLLLSFFWPFRIPADVLALPSRGAFGPHPSLLPRWRGPDPTFWTVRTRDQVTGVTLHRLAAAYDEGPIVARREVDVRPDEDAWSLARRLDRPALAMLVDCAAGVAAGRELTAEPQDESLATWARIPTPDDLAVEWREPAESIAALVRAAGHRRGADARLGRTDVEIVRAEIFVDEVPHAIEVAEAWPVERGLVVRCGEGALLVRQVRDLEGRVYSGTELHPLAKPARMV